jgi:hypothetical protein
MKKNLKDEWHQVPDLQYEYNLRYSAMIDMKIIEELRNFGEIKSILGKQDNEFIQWVMRIGESRNILNNAITEFKHIRKIMNELEHNIPQFHKQPGMFKEFEHAVENIIGVIGEVNRKLSYVEEAKPKETPFICSECGEEEDNEDDYDE